MAITHEQLKSLLQITAVEDLKIFADNGELFERFFQFVVEGVKYTIQWYANYSTLYIGNINGPLLIFYNVEYSNTWPTGNKMNLQFMDNNNQKIFILPVERYK